MSTNVCPTVGSIECLPDDEIIKLNFKSGAAYVKARKELTQEISQSSHKIEKTFKSPKMEPRTEPARSKHKCSEAQLAALAAGRAKNRRTVKNSA